MSSIPSLPSAPEWPARPRWVVLGAWLALAGACGGAPASTLRVDSVEPRRVPFGVDSQVLVRGDFEPKLALDLSSKGESTLVEDFEVEVAGVRAVSAKRLQTDLLEVVLPAGLPFGSQPLTVTDPRGDQVTLADAVEVYAPEPARIAFVTSMRAAEVGAWTQPIRVALLDAEGNLSYAPRPVTLQLSSDSQTGRLARVGDDIVAGEATLSLTLPRGAQSVDFTYSDPTEGYHTLLASAEGFEAISQPVVVGHPGDASLVRVMGDHAPTTSAGEPYALVVEVQDVAGGPAAIPPNGIRVEVTAPPSLGVALEPGGPFLPTQAAVVQAGTGRAAFFVQGTKVGSALPVDVTATNLSTGGLLGPDRLALTVAPGALASFEVLRTTPGDAVAGTPQHFVARALDRYGNAVTSWSGGATLQAGSATLASSLFQVAASTTGTDGTFEQDLVVTQAGQTVVTVSDQASPPHVGQTAPFVVQPAAFAGFDVGTPSGAQVAGAPFSVVVRAVDVYGNTVPESHQVSLSASNVALGAISPSVSPFFVGSTTLAVSITQATSDTALTVTEGAFSRASGGFAVRPGPIQRFEVGNVASAQTAGAPFALTLRALDAYGNETLDTHDVALSAAGVSAGALSPATSGSFIGHVTLQVSVTEAATGIRISAGDASASGAQTSPFDVRAAAVAGFRLTPPSCVVSGVAFALGLEAVDAYGNRNTGFTGTVQLSSQVSFSPGKTGNFSGGALTLLNAKVSNVGAVPRTVTLQAVDSSNAARTGSTPLSIQASCP